MEGGMFKAAVIPRRVIPSRAALAARHPSVTVVPGGDGECLTGSASLSFHHPTGGERDSEKATPGLN